MDKKEIGKNIKSIRQQKLLSREYISKKLDISIHTLAKYEQGQREPSIDMIDKIAQVLEVPTEEIYGFKKNVYDLIDILSKDKVKKIPSSKDKEILKQTLERLEKTVDKRIDEINNEALNGMINIGFYASLDDEMQILKKATDEQIENILDNLGRQLKFELFELKNAIKDK